MMGAGPPGAEPQLKSDGAGRAKPYRTPDRKAAFSIIPIKFYSEFIKDVSCNSWIGSSASAKTIHELRENHETLLTLAGFQTSTRL